MPSGRRGRSHDEAMANAHALNDVMWCTRQHLKCNVSALMGAAPKAINMPLAKMFEPAS